MVGIFQQIPLWFIVLYDFAHRALVCPQWNCGLFKILEKVVKKHKSLSQQPSFSPETFSDTPMPCKLKEELQHEH